MGTSQVKRDLTNLLLSGYEHYSREEERLLMDSLLLNGEEFPAHIEIPTDQYPLAQHPLRSVKNMSICLVAVICRYAADHGADDRRSYALSDTYINIIEEQNDVGRIYELIANVVVDYQALIQEGREQTYSRPVQRAIRLIDARLYEPCTLALIAQESQLHPTYLSKLFKDEVGRPITHFIRERKIAEAKNLLTNTEHSIAEIADMLGYSTPSYFSKVFRQTTNTTPRNFALIDLNSGN